MIKYLLPFFVSDELRVQTRALALILPLIALTACDGGKDEGENSSSSPPKSSSPTVPQIAEVVKKPEFPQLPDYVLGKIAEQSVLIRVDGHPDQSGILIKGNNQISGRYEYQIVCNPPTAPDAILCATMFGGQLLVNRASKIATLPNGLHIYGFSSKQILSGYINQPNIPTGPFYACRLEATGAMTQESRVAITEKLTSAKQRLEALREAGRVPPNRVRPSERPPTSREEMETMRQAHQASMKEHMELSREVPTLEAQVSMAVDRIAASQILGAATEAELGGDTSALAGSVLVSRDSGVFAIRHDNQWIHINKLLEDAVGKPSQITVNLSGDKNQVQLTCKVDWALAFGKTACSIVAATTFELESLDGGSIEERLAKVKPVPMMMNGSKPTVQRSLRWNGEPTSLWIKVFQDDQLDKPIIDEVVLLDYTDRFQAKWGRPPSPLIAIPQPEPDTPPDLAGEAKILDARGNVLDLVTAGDGSMLMVQTDKPPFWQPLDLRTGQFIETSWKASADTLLAAQAGKIYLIDRKTKILETWDIEGKSRRNLQILQFDGEIVSVAAPLSASDSPILISTTKEAAFVNPLNFEMLANGFDMSSCFSPDEEHRGLFPKLKPESIRLRASNDGTLFAISGILAAGNASELRHFRIVVDPTLSARSETTQVSHLPAKGRLMTETFPDHGGREIQLRTSAGSSYFPAPPGTILFVSNESKKTIGELRRAPVVPPASRMAKGPLARDRGLYYDSSLEVLVLPDAQTIHLIPIYLPGQPPAAPEFNFEGETISIPLPKGSGHKLVSSIGGDITISATEIQWRVPAPAHAHIQSSQVNLKLEWIGELGTAMNASFNYSIKNQAAGLSVESSDGKTSLPLRRVGIISEGGRMEGFAGSGHVLLTNAGSKPQAWSLTDCSNLFTSSDRFRKFFGDADQLYTYNDDGILKAYDILTGALVKEALIGKPNDGGRGLTGITTGISSRYPLLAVERDGINPYLQLIDRKTLEPTLLNFSRDRQQLFVIPQFQTNPSGNVTWSQPTAISREGNQINLQVSSNFHYSGSPDESGRYVVSSDGILDISTDPPVVKRYKDLPDAEKFSFMTFDDSGRYVLFRQRGDDSKNFAASVRDIRSPEVELFKIRIPTLSGTVTPRMVSGVGKLICQVDSAFSRIGVFELNVPAIMQELAAKSQTPNTSPR